MTRRRAAEERTERWHLEKQLLHLTPSHRFSRIRYQLYPYKHTHTIKNYNCKVYVYLYSWNTCGRCVSFHCKPIKVSLRWAKHSFLPVSKSSCGMAEMSHSCQETTSHVQRDTCSIPFPSFTGNSKQRECKSLSLRLFSINMTQSFTQSPKDDKEEKKRNTAEFNAPSLRKLIQYFISVFNKNHGLDQFLRFNIFSDNGLIDWHLKSLA